MATLSAIFNGIRNTIKVMRKIRRYAGEGFKGAGKYLLHTLLGVLKGYLKGIIIYLLIIVVVGATLIEGVQAIFDYFDENGGNAYKVSSSMSKEDAERLSENASGINPRKVKYYMDTEGESYPKTIPAKIVTDNNGQVTSKDLTLDVKKFAEQFRIPWQFIAASDAVRVTGDIEEDKELINSSKTSLAPSFQWATDKYTKDVTDYTKIYEVEKVKDLKTGVETEVRNTRDTVNPSYVIVKNPLPFADSVTTPFKTYNYHYKLDVVTKDTAWSSPILVGTQVVKEEQVADGTLDDLSKPIYGTDTSKPIYGDDISRPIYGSEHYKLKVYNGSTSKVINFLENSIIIKGNPSVSDTYIWSASYNAYDDNYYILHEADNSSKQLWIKKDQLNYYTLIAEKYKISFNGGTSPVRDITGYGKKIIGYGQKVVGYEQKTVYKTLRKTTTTYKITKQKVIEDMMSGVDETLNPQQMFSFFQQQEISTDDLQLIHDVIAQLPDSSELVDDIQRILDGNFETGLGGVGGDVIIDPSGLTADIPLFIQWDPRWGKIPYGSHGTLGSSACGPTSAAMVLTGLGANLGILDKNGDGILDPAESASYSVANGFRVSEGTAWSYFKSIGSKAGVKVTQYDTSQYAAVLQHLNAGHPVVASMRPGHFTRGGHFIVLTGVAADGKIKVNDSNSPERSKMSWDFLSIIVAEAAQFWAFENPNGDQGFEDYVGTAYDLTYASCQKYPWDPGYGITASGLNLKGKSIADKYIAVDPKLIPLNSFVYIKFPPGKDKATLPNGQVVNLNGRYKAVDTGGAIKQKRIDLFFGEDGPYRTLALSWGRNNIKVKKLKN